MTIHIKHSSGGSIVELAKLWHDSIADMYRAKYALVPVKVRKRRTIKIGGLLERRLMQLKAQRIVRERHT